MHRLQKFEEMCPNVRLFIFFLRKFAEGHVQYRGSNTGGGERCDELLPEKRDLLSSLVLNLFLSLTGHEVRIIVLMLTGFPHIRRPS